MNNLTNERLEEYKRKRFTFAIYEDAQSMASELLDIRGAAEACVDIYMSIHVSEVNGKPDYLKKAWSVGQELYIKKCHASHDARLLQSMESTNE